jgi:hypothetical protein
LPSKRTPENHVPRDGDADPLAGLHYELLCDLNDVTQKQEQEASGALATQPSSFQLILEVKKFARVLADACRSHTARCAEIHANSNDDNPAGAALETLGLVLCKHLELPPDTSLLMSELMTEVWPESNGVSRFVLEVADAPADPNDFLRRQLRLPRWEVKGRGVFGRLSRTESVRPRPAGNDPFLSVEETQGLLRELEESFRNHLSDRLRLVFATALSAVAALSDRAAVRGKLGDRAFRSDRRRFIADYMRTHPDSSNREILTHLRERQRWLIPKSWEEDEKLAFDTFTKIGKKLGISRKKASR